MSQPTSSWFGLLDKLFRKDFIGNVENKIKY